MKKIIKTLPIAIVSIVLSIPQAFAGPRPSHDVPPPSPGAHDHYEPYNRRPYNYYHSLPPGYLTLRIADMILYYLDGIYYRETPSGYVVVNAPAGAIIQELPPYYKRIPYGNTVYYYYNNTYYVQNPNGYIVVTPPPQVITSNPTAVETPQQTVVVTVPNQNGSYIPVTLEKYSDGYKGPKGEFYPDYPTIDQLKAMYAIDSGVAERPLPDELEFNVPNKNGSTTKVKLTRTKDGYVGPSGEYYKEKPTMDQLKIMYAK